MNEADLAERAAQFLEKRWKGFQPRTLIGLGSGLGEACRDMTVHDEVVFSDVPGFAPPTVAGHAGRLRVGHVVRRTGPRLAWSHAPCMKDIPSTRSFIRSEPPHGSASRTSFSRI